MRPDPLPPRAVTSHLTYADLRGRSAGDPAQPLVKPRTMEDNVATSVAQPRFRTWLIGIFAGLGMYVTAAGQHNPNALLLSFVVFLAMIGSCVASGISGALVPLTLKRFGFDPATASAISLTTATDVVSMGMLLGLATMLVR